MASGKDMGTITKITKTIDLIGHGYDGETVELTEQNIAFCHYIAGGKSQTEARLLAGYKDHREDESLDPKWRGNRNSASAAQLMRSNPDVAYYANYLQEQHRRKLSLTTEDLLKNIAAVVNFDPASVFNPDGSPIENINDVPLTARMAIKKMKVMTRIINEEEVTLYEYEFYDKLAAIGLLTRLQELAGDKMKARMNGRSVALKRAH